MIQCVHNPSLVIKDKPTVAVCVSACFFNARYRLPIKANLIEIGILIPALIRKGVLFYEKKVYFRDYQ
jgi:hypothetical protein